MSTAATCVNIDFPTTSTSMPLFTRSKSMRRSKRKNKIKKTDISDPVDFHHCYHAEYDRRKEGFLGLPTQWKSLLDTEGDSRVSKSVGNTPESIKRPKPIIRGSQSGVQEAVDCVKDQYGSFGGENYDAERNDQQEEFIDIALGSCSDSQSSSCNSSLQRLVPPYTAVTVPTTNPTVSYSAQSQVVPPSHTSAPTRLPPFSFNAPLDVMQSDISICTNSSGIIYSPSESSGYFGSTMSSLNSSRMSSTQHSLSSSSSTTNATYQHPSPPHHPALMPVRSYQPFETTDELAQVHKFASLQRPPKQNKEQQLIHNTLSLHKHYQLRQQQNSRMRGTYLPTSLSSQDTVTGMQRSNNTPAVGNSHHSTSRHSHQTTSNHAQKSKVKDRGGKMSDEQFRESIKLLVNPCDPRKDLDGFVKIGVGSTGSVYTAYRISNNQIVAVKKMNLFNQQRKELLFNEVSSNNNT